MAYSYRVQPLPLQTVGVKKGHFIRQCKRVDRGWKCGACNHGLFPVEPLYGQECKVCKAVIVVLDRMPS